MTKTWFLEIGILLAVLVITFVVRIDDSERISPSDVVCMTNSACRVGDVNFTIGDIVSSERYSFGMKAGEIIILNPNNNTALIKWANGMTTTEPLEELSKLKNLVN